MADTNVLMRGANLRHIFLSHQDPDIVAACNGWLMTSDAAAHIWNFWVRFVPHFGLDHLVQERLEPIPDQGTVLELEHVKLPIIPAHFLHSCGNFQVYDPVSKILYTGDLGASLGQDYIYVRDFDGHLTYMDGFHRRFMANNAVMAAWARMARTLDIDIIAPQHGAIFKGPELVNKFIDWCEALPCGIDTILPMFKVPSY